MKELTFNGLIGLIGGAISAAFGGWSAALTTLLIFMAIDYVTGLMVAGIFKNSTKTKTGGLESKAGFKGLCRKGVTLLIVLVAYRLDLLIGTSYIKDAVTVALATNELISMVENFGLMGVPIPKQIIKAIDILKQREDEKENADSEQE